MVMHAIAPTRNAVAWRRNETTTEITERYEKLSKNIATAVLSRDRLFPNDADGTKTAALVLSIAQYESGFDKLVGNGKKRGDGGRSWCYMQMNLGGGAIGFGPPEMKLWRGVDLVQDPVKCFVAGIETLRISMERCKYYKGAAKLSAYTSGRCQATERGAIHRWEYAWRLVAKYPRPLLAAVGM